MGATRTRRATDDWARFSRWLSRAHDLVLDPEQARRLRALDRRQSLLFPFSRRSYLDGVTVPAAIAQNGITPAFVLAGANLDVFPVNHLLRRSGFVYVRRSTADLPVYRLVLRAYVAQMIRNRRNLCWSIEGGRTRTGLYVLDEPISGVDALTRTRLWGAVRSAADGGAGVLVTTHSMEEAQECDRLVMMAAGRRVAEGSVAGIVGTARVTTVDCDDWPAALRTLADAGLRAALVGRLLRVPGAGPGRVREILAGVPATVGEAAASLEERFVELTAAAEGP